MAAAEPPGRPIIDGISDGLGTVQRGKCRRRPFRRRPPAGSLKRRLVHYREGRSRFLAGHRRWMAALRPAYVQFSTCGSDISPAVARQEEHRGDGREPEADEHELIFGNPNWSLDGTLLPVCLIMDSQISLRLRLTEFPASSGAGRQRSAPPTGTMKVTTHPPPGLGV